MFDRKNEMNPDYLRLLDGVMDYAIFTVSLRGLVTSWNMGARQILGFTPDEVIGKSHRVFYSREDLDANFADRDLNDAAASGSKRHNAWRLKKDGSRFWSNESITALRNDKGEVSGFLVIAADLSEQKATEDETMIRTAELSETNEALRKSEEKYHSMISEIPDYAIILMDNDGTILDWNKGAEKIKFYKPQEIIGRNFRTFYSAEDREAKLPESLLAAAISEGSVNHEGWRVRKDGTRFWGLVSISALHNEAGDVIGFSKVTRDLTERKRAEDRLNSSAEVLRRANEALQQSEEKFHRMIAEVKDYALLLIDPNGTIQNWNAGAQQIKGYTAKEAIGKNFRMFYTPQDREAGLPERLLAEAESKGRAEHEGLRVKKDGTRFWGSVVITALHNDAGELIGFSKVTRDLTARKKAEDDLRENVLQVDQKNKLLQRLNEELESFNYVASHDLREPLRKVLTYVSLIGRTPEMPDKTITYMDRIRQAAERGLSLIDDLLSLSKVSNDKSRFQMIDLNEVVARAKDDLDLVIREKNARVSFERLPTISGVGFQLEQLFINLISNGLKFANTDPVIRIAYTLGEYPTPDNEMMTCHRVIVSDNGMGFEQQYASLIFGAFQRLETNGKSAGTGIGLAIVKKVMENHGGWVSAEGRPGEGATFCLFFPAVASISSSNSSPREFLSQQG